MARQPPRSFDEDAYVAANPDVRDAILLNTFKSGWDHYRQWGHLEQRPLHPDSTLSRVEKLCAGLQLNLMKGVEIGPLTRPIVTKSQSDILYVDHADTETLRRKYDNDLKIKPAEIVEVDYVWGSQTLPECLGTGVLVDYVIASHVVEHVPDIVSWFKEISGILKPGGTVRLAVPDRRFTFDILRTESTLADALDAYLRRTRIPLPRAILDHFLNYADIKASDAWAGRTEDVRRTHDPVFAWEAASRSYQEGSYQDTHCWVFTPLSFARLCSALAGMGLLGFECDRIYRISEGELEFVTILRSADPGSSIASWERTIQLLEVDQGLAAQGIAR